MNYEDIEKFTCEPTYCVYVPWGSIERSLGQYSVDINPDFQRGHVWNEEQQRAYIEFRIRGGMSGQDIFINNPTMKNRSKLPDEGVLVDGKQRLEAVRKFMNNKLTIFNGHYMKDIEGMEQEVNSMSGLHFNFKVNGLQKRSEVLRWYLELNSGGVIHTKEELDRVQNLLTQETNLLLDKVDNE